MDSLGIALQNRSLDVVKQNTQISFSSENRAVVCHDIFENTSKWEVVRTVCFCTSCHERNPRRNFHENHLGQLSLEFKKCGYWLEAFLFLFFLPFVFVKFIVFPQHVKTTMCRVQSGRLPNIARKMFSLWANNVQEAVIHVVR